MGAMRWAQRWFVTSKRMRPHFVYNYFLKSVSVLNCENNTTVTYHILIISSNLTLPSQNDSHYSSITVTYHAFFIGKNTTTM